MWMSDRKETEDERTRQVEPKIVELEEAPPDALLELEEAPPDALLELEGAPLDACWSPRGSRDTGQKSKAGSGFRSGKGRPG